MILAMTNSPWLFAATHCESVLPLLLPAGTMMVTDTNCNPSHLRHATNGLDPMSPPCSAMTTSTRWSSISPTFGLGKYAPNAERMAWRMFDVAVEWLAHVALVTADTVVITRL